MQIVRYLGSTALLGLSTCGITPFLTSCSTVYPTFTITNTSKDWTQDTSVSADAIWKGYYFNDVNAPWEVGGVDIPTEHKKDVVLDLQDSKKIKDDAHKTQFANVYFNILTTGDVNKDKPFDIHVTWTIKHTNFKKVSTITITPPEAGIININTDLNYASKPTTDYDNIYPNNPQYDSYQCIDGIYNGKGQLPEPYENMRQSLIETHLTNDLVWYQYLIYSSIEYVYIDDSTNTYSKLDYSTWKFHIELKYNFNTQIFDYITLHVEASGKVYVLGLVPFDGNIVVDYNWGQMADPDKGIEAVPGPKLMGAYKVSTEDNKAHYPQGYNVKDPSSPIYQPYNQDFLSLVPSNANSYQNYNITISAKQLPAMSSGQHVYFMSQPRFLGLEYTSGLQHLILKSQYPDTDDPHDSFRNWQFTMPSYTLSGMSYDATTSTWEKAYEQISINQCYVDISPDQYFSNYLGDSESRTKQQWADDFMWNNNYVDVNLNDDPNFIAERKAQNVLQDQCLNGGSAAPWKNINIYTTKDGIKLNDDPVPYYQIIQQPSHNCWKSSSSSRGLNIAEYLEDNLSAHNITVDASGHFNRFAIGLNYMFMTDNMQTKADNVFYYNEEQVKAMDNNFNNNPS